MAHQIQFLVEIRTGNKTYDSFTFSVGNFHSIIAAEECQARIHADFPGPASTKNWLASEIAACDTSAELCPDVDIDTIISVLMSKIRTSISTSTPASKLRQTMELIEAHLRTGALKIFS